MGLRPILTLGALALAGVVVVASVAAQEEATPAPDPELMWLVQREAAWYPDSIFKMSKNDRGVTPSGSYRVVGVDRECSSKLLSGTQTLIVDDVAGIAWIGSVARLPFRQAGIAPTGLGKFLEDFLPEALLSNLRLKTKVEWGSGPHRAGSVIPFWLLIDTGYGEYRKQAAVTSDGEWLVLGSGFPLGQDPVEQRRRLLASNDLVMWDTHGGEDSAVDIVEFSDFECPACRRRWPLIKNILEEHGSDVRHGMVSTPLTTIHPWSFRAASATWCVASQDAEALVPFKELFYSVQPEMEVSLVTQTSKDFVVGSGLDEATFTTCYLEEPSLAAVHGQLALGQQLGVIATPTFFVNGWKIQAPNEEWFPDMIKRVKAGDDLL
jgi:hypothetical protein